MDTTILLFLLQDGITSGAIYALLGLALVLVFAVTRVILIPQGEFITFGALTSAMLSAGQMPGTALLALVLGAVAFAFDVVAARNALHARLALRSVAVNIALPLAIYAATAALEGLRGPAMADTAFSLGPLCITGQSLGVYAITILLIVGLWLLFGYTLYGKALRATAVNRLGARIVGIRTSLSGQIAFLLAAVIGAISGILIVPITTIYYDTGFLIGLKGFVAAIIGGMVSYPLTAAAAIVVGIVEAFSSFYASNFKEVIVFTLLLPVLVLRSLASPEVEEESD